MALNDPYDPYGPAPIGLWDDDFDARYRAAMGDVQAPAPFEVNPIGPETPTVLPSPPPPPPPPPSRDDKARIALPGAPVAEEVPRSAFPPALTTETVEAVAPTLSSDSTTPQLDVDAISGVGPTPKAGDYVGPGQTSGKPELPDDYMTGDEYGQKLTTLPFEQQEMIRGKIEGAKQNFQATRLLEESAKTRERAEQNAQDYADSVKLAHQKAAELDADAKTIASQDPLDAIPTWRKVLGVIASIIGGFAPHGNVGLQAVSGLVDQAAAMQRTKLAEVNHQRGALGENVARAGDLYKAEEATRLAAWDGVIGRLESEVQQFDPRGTTALRVMDTINQAKAKRAEHAAKYLATQQKQIENALKEQREIAQLQETQRHNVAGEKTDATRAYADLLRAKTEDKKATAEAGTTYTPEQLGQLYGVTDPALVPPIPMNPKQYDKWLEAKQKGGQVTKVTQETAAEERNRELAVGEIVDDQGNPVKFRTPEFAGKLAKSKGSADNAVRLIDKIIAARTKSGWESDWVNGPVKRQLAGDMASLQLEKKNTDELGVLAGPDMDLINKSIGTADPSEWRDSVLPGLRNARSNIVEQLNAKVRAEAVMPKGRTLQRYEPPELADLPESRPLIQGKTSIEQGESAKRGKAGEAIQKTFYGVSNEEAAAAAENAAKSGPTGLAPDDDKRVLEAIKAAQSGGKDAANALQRLADAASSDREAVSFGVLNRVRIEAPDLFDQVLAKLPPEKRAAIQQINAIDESKLPPWMRGGQ